MASPCFEKFQQTCVLFAEGADNQGDNPLPPETVLCLREGSQEALLSETWRVGREFLVKESKLAPVLRPDARPSSVCLVLHIHTIV